MNRRSPAWRRAAHAVLLCTIAAGAARADAQQRIHRGLPASPTVSMRLYVPAGHVRIAVWSRDSIDIAGTIADSTSMFGGGDREHSKFGVGPIRTDDTRLPSADWVVTVPRKARVWVKMTSGTIESDGTEGELELYDVGGSITVRRATGVTSVEAIDAAVSIIGSGGDIRVRGGKALLVLQDVSGTASVTSISGRVELRGASAPEGRIETIGGDIAIDVPRLRGATLELQTHSGGIAIAVDRSALPELELASRTGAVTNAAPRGTRAQGRVVARSFRGAISVRVTKR